MKTDLGKEALYQTQVIMEHWYACDLRPVKKTLDKNSSWIGGATGQFYIGKDAVVKGLELAGSHVVPCTLSSQIYTIVDSGTDYYVVAGSFMMNLENKTMSLHEWQRLTFIWKVSYEHLSLTHVHVSCGMGAIAPDEDFPVKAAKASYEYLRAKISQGVVTVMDTERILHRLEKGSVNYLAADNKYVEIHTADLTIRIHQNLNDFQKKVFPKFLMVHRSYCVNSMQIKMLRKFEVEMKDGTVLPVSKRRYADLCKRLGVKI